jgi:phosphatidylinositol alpha-1,6-mannosyltransferase
MVADAFGGTGGIAEYDRNLLSSLAACELIKEVVVLPRQGTSSFGPPAPIRQLSSVEGRINYSFAAFRAALSSQPIDIVFCGHIYMVPLATVIARLVNAPLWVQVHGIEAWQELSWLHRRSLESAALITSVSRYTRRRLLEWCAIEPTRIKVLPNTLDLRFMPGPKPGYLVDRHDLLGKKVITTVARLSSKERYKGHDRVMRCLPQVLAHHPETIYLIVGDGDDRHRLELLAIELAIQNKVVFAGFVSTAEMPDYFRVADVFAMPSTAEGFGIVFLEALASGIDVIAGNGDGSVDALGDGALGRVVDPENCQELALAVCASLDQPRRNSDRAVRFRHEVFSQHMYALLVSALWSKDISYIPSGPRSDFI